MALPDTSPRVGLIGLGLMGRPMALNLRRAGVPLVVHNRSAAAVEVLQAAGAVAARSAGEVARMIGDGIVILMLPDGAAVESVLQGVDGLAGSLAPGALVIDMGTASVEETRRWAGLVATRRARWLDAPVSGGQTGAEQATLSIMVGGAAEDFARAQPLLACLGSCLNHLGPTGAGQAAKLANQIVVGVTLNAIAEAFALAAAAGADLSRLRDALLGGFASSRLLELHGRRMIEGDFRPGGPAVGQHRGMAAALALATELGVSLPLTESSLTRWAELLQRGSGGLDHAAIWTLYQRVPS